MISKNLYVQILLRVLLLLTAALALFWIIFSPVANILSLIPSIILLGTCVNIIYFLNRVNRRIFYFFDAIKNNDSTLSFPEISNNRIVKNLSETLQKVNGQIQLINSENQKQEQYFQALIEHAATGMFTFNVKGFVLHSNSLAKQLFGIEQLTHITQLETIDPRLYRTVKEMLASEQRLTALSTPRGVVQLLLKASSFISENEELMIISVQDIKHQLDEKELDSWRRLIQVMMHEIMNSITPVTSLSESLAGYFYLGGKLKTPEQIDAKTIETTIQGLELIREQGKGLISFVESYRKLTRLPEPVKKVFVVRHLIENIDILSRSFPNAEKVELFCEIDPMEQELMADEKQISQVLINLVKNAFQAQENTPGATVRITSLTDEKGHPEIRVTDNGPGIPDEIMDKIFIPFFTTKESGSGIGLSISRQIMQLHGGSLKIDSIPGDVTHAVLSF